MVTRSVRHYDREERQYDKAETAESVRKTRSPRFHRRRPASTHPLKKQQDEVWVLRGFQKFLGFLSINSRTFWWNNNCAWIDGAHLNKFLTIGMSLCFTGVVLSTFSIQSILETALIARGKQSKEGRQTIFFTSLNPFGENPDEKAPSDDITIPKKIHCQSNWKRKKDAVYWVKVSRAQDQGLQF